MGNTSAKKKCQCKILQEEVNIYKNLCNEMTEMIIEKSETERKLKKEIEDLKNMINSDLIRVNRTQSI